MQRESIAPVNQSQAYELAMQLGVTVWQHTIVVLRSFLQNLTLVSVLCVLSGCSSYHRDLQRGEQLELAGDYAGALAVYDRAVPKIPADQPALRGQGFLRLGECLLRLGRMTDAFNAFHQALELDPSNLEAHRRVAELLIAGGLPDRAIEHANFILSKDATSASAFTLLGTAAVALGDSATAEKQYRAALKADPKMSKVAIALAELLGQQERVNDARVVLLTATAASPSDPSPWLALGRLEEQEGLPVPAEAAYRAALKAKDTPDTSARLSQFLQRTGRIDEARKVLALADESRPSHPPALADLQLNLGHAREALALYGRRLSALLGPKEDLAARKQILVRMIESQLEDGGNLEHARMLLRQSDDVVDDVTRDLLEAEIALASNDVASAERLSARALTAGAPTAAAWFVRGLVLDRTGHPVEARSMWGQALALDPEHLPSLAMMARTNLEAGESVEAEPYIVTVVRAEPANLKALLLYGRILLAQGRIDAAESIATRAAAVAPTRPEPMVLMGDLAVRRNQLASALVHFQKAVTVSPDDPAALDGLLRVYRAGNFTRPMLRKLEAIAEAPPLSATLYEIAGRLYAENGWKKDAMRALSRAVEIDSRRTSAVLALSGVYSDTGDLRSAAEIATRSGSLSRISPATTSLVAALAAEQRDATAESERSYEAAVAHGDRSGVAANNLAWLYAVNRKKLDRALELALSARSRQPDDPAVLDTLGFVYLRRGDYSAAVITLQAAAARSGADLLPIIHSHLEEARSRAGLTPAPSVSTNR
jgi:tetratricopeptide (TPR) repeat protein